MAESADRTDVRRLSATDAQLAEVLPRHEFVEEHLPGAISLPLGDFSGEKLHCVRTQTPAVKRWDDGILVAVGGVAPRADGLRRLLRGPPPRVARRRAVRPAGV